MRHLFAALCGLILLVPGRAQCQDQGFLPQSLDQGLFRSISRSALPGVLDSPQLLQASPTPPTTPNSPNAKTPEPYTKEEFPQWLQDLWRVGVIFVGSLPFSYFYTLESYDLYRYAMSGFDYTQAPWPFRAGSEITYTSGEQVWLVVTAVGLSAIITGVDFLIDQISRSDER
jgi:hypothetical protein